MKRLLALLSASFFLFSCNFTNGSGKIVTEKRTVENFSAISACSAIEVEVNIGPVAAVTVEADDNIIQHVLTSVSGGTLKIKTENLHNLNNAHIKVFVTTPVIEAITASASADVKVVAVIKGNNKLSFKASSSAGIEAEVDAPEVEAEANSSGTVTLKGCTKNYKAAVSSSGDIKTAALLSENTEVDASSSGSAQVYASITLNAKASSSGSIDYRGAATVQQSVNSSGSVDKKD